MKLEPTSESGRLLYRLLPLVYRRWDGRGRIDPRHPESQTARGDLATYLDAGGTVLDGLRGVIEQRLADLSPETCQPWLIPYFADLLDVRLVSPDVEGQRTEVARAVAWRQRKGTLGCIEEVARAVGRFERIVRNLPGAAPAAPAHAPFPTVVIHEGYRRVATTVTIGRPLPSRAALGLDAGAENASSPIRAALHPGLPAGTVDFRFLSRARQTEVKTLASRENAFGDQAVRWRQEHPRGAPCHPGGYDDASVRTPDVRAPGHARGHFHPHRVLVHACPRDGFFVPGALEVTWSALSAWLAPADPTDRPPPFSDWDERPFELVRERLLRTLRHGPDTVRVIERERQLRGDGAGGTMGTRHELVAGIVAAPGDDDIASRIEPVGAASFALVAGFELVDEAAAGMGAAPARRILRGFGATPPAITVDVGGLPVGARGLALGALGGAGAAGATVHRLERVVVHGPVAVDGVPLELAASAIQALAGPPGAGPLRARAAVGAVDCLFERVALAGGACQLETCTVLGEMACAELAASDCILQGAVSGGRGAAALSRLDLRYCAVPWLAADAPEPPLGRGFALTRQRPLFLEQRFGKPGAGVLHPAAPAAIRAGAEDGGEIGAYHGQHHVLREQAVLDKLRELVSVSLAPALIPHAPWNRPIPTP